MGRRAVIILALLSLLSHVAVAQEEEQQQEYQQLFGYDNSEEPIKIIEVDTTLFRAPSSIGTDPYSDATRYYQAQGASRRRGLYYTTGQYITEPLIQYITTLREPTPRSEVALYGAQSLYRVALRALDARPLSQGWSLQSSLWAQTGRDAFVEGVFRNRFSPEVVVSKRFEDDHFLTLRTSLYYSSQGLQYGSTAEAYELTGSNYYNPTWGFYNGKARNSRVRGELSPQIEAHYQRPIKPRSTLTLDATLDYSRQSNSSLGWYNAYTPTPDYYTKMPSYLPAGELKEYTTELWRTNNSDYTQVNWDELIRLNSLSRDGNAYYVLEERIKSSLKSQASIILHTDFTPNMRLSYGIEASIEQNRNFKVAEDLLGASHLMDYDQFMGDSYNKTLPLQNNLQEPDR